MTEQQKKKLLKEARLASTKSYSPYSNFKVGAAVLDKRDHIFCGTNIENASYGLTICAERIAIGHAISHQGASGLVAIAVYTNGINSSPCGACRQVIVEFGKDIIVLYNNNNQLQEKRISELLIDTFSL